MPERLSLGGDRCGTVLPASLASSCPRCGSFSHRYAGTTGARTPLQRFHRRVSRHPKD